MQSCDDNICNTSRRYLYVPGPAGSPGGPPGPPGPVGPAGPGTPTGTPGNFVFIAQSGTNTVSTSNLFISTSNLIGVGTTAPGTLLDVNGDMHALTASILGSTGQTTLNVTGNVYVSNALSTTNVFAATETLTGATEIGRAHV